MWGPSRVGWAWIGAVALSVGLGATGFWIGGALGTGIGVAAGGLTPLLIERATRKQETIESARAAERPQRQYGLAHLLEPGVGVVPFTGRTRELEALEAWCLDEDAGLLRLVTGGGGAGKTRLALELRRRMTEQHWRCVEVDEGAEHDAVQLERKTASRAQLLLVVDYAETRAGLEDLLKAALRDEGPVRVLLLARHAGDWWQRLGAGGGAVRDVTSDASRWLMPLASELVPGLTANDVVRRAVPFFATRLEMPSPDPRLVSVLGEGEPRILDLHAAALVACLEARERPAESRLQIDTTKVLETLLEHETHYWLGRANAARLLDGTNGLIMAQLFQVAAAGCMLGAGTTRELAGRVPGVTVTEPVALWLRELYPPDKQGALGSLRPDRLAELHVTRELAASPELAEACLTGLDANQARRALILLARASAEHQAARTLLESSLSRFPDVVAGLAAPRQVMIAVADAIPYPSLALAAAHASISSRIAATYAAGTTERALWQNTLAVVLSSLGRREEALTAIIEAIITRRDLAASHPDRFLPDLASSLSNQSLILSNLGRREKAMAAIDEATTVYRDLAAHSAIFLPNFASSLTNLSLCLVNLGRREEALIVIEEVVPIRRDLAAAHPDAFLPDLAKALNNLSLRLADLGRTEEALTPMEESVTIYRNLAAARPDAFLPDLAMSLSNHSSRLADLGRKEDALTAVDESVTIRRDLAANHPDPFVPDLASSLNNLSLRLADLGQTEEALTAVDEAVSIDRDLAAAHPDAFLPDLAMSLSNRSAWLGSLGRHSEALTAVDEAVSIDRDLAAAHPDAFLPELAKSLNNRSAWLGSLGRPLEALAAVDEAISINRRLAGAHPDAFLPELAKSLNNRSAFLESLGRHSKALAAVDEAIIINRGLAAAHPDTYLPELAESLKNQSKRLLRLGPHPEVLAAVEEAISIYRRLVAAHPDAFRPELARSLTDLASRWADLGQMKKGLTAIEEATAIYRTLAAAHPDAFLFDLSISLTYQSSWLSGLGRRQEALAVIGETVAIRHDLVSSCPVASIARLARLLDVQASILSKLGRDADAQTARDEAAVIRNRAGGQPR